MMLKAYYDSSGTNDEESKVLTLAGVAASEHTWLQFEADWKRILNSYGEKSFHMSKVMSLPHRGWEKEKVRSFINDIFNVIGKLRTKHFKIYTCSIILNDYRRAKSDIPGLRPPEAICVNFCVGGLQLLPEDLDSPKSIKLYFDRNEPFLNTINVVWNRAKNKCQTTGWPKQIHSITSVDSISTYPIQAADMFAWMMHRHYTHSDKYHWDWYTFLIADHYAKMYDYDRIKNDYPSG